MEQRERLIIGGIRCLLDACPEDLPRRDLKALTPAVPLADVHRPNEAVLITACNRKRANEPAAFTVLLVLCLPPPTISDWQSREDSPLSGLRSDVARTSSS
jgi:hypothetical protein